jgi:hypothetical protein
MLPDDAKPDATKSGTGVQAGDAERGEGSQSIDRENPDLRGPDHSLER